MCHNNSTIEALCGHHNKSCCSKPRLPSYLAADPISLAMVPPASRPSKTSVHHQYFQSGSPAMVDTRYSSTGGGHVSGAASAKSRGSSSRRQVRGSFPKLGASSWVCCNCGHGSNSIIYNAKCIECNHKRDSSCTKW